MFFIVIYVHMFRAIFYGSFKKPRELIWLFGMTLFVPSWRKPSWVICCLGGRCPIGSSGHHLAVRRDSGHRRGPCDLGAGRLRRRRCHLNRFFALHVVGIPLAILILVVFHLVALRTTGSSNPDGIEIKKQKSETVFHRRHTVSSVLHRQGSIRSGHFPDRLFDHHFLHAGMGGYFLEHPNFEPANPAATP